MLIVYEYRIMSSRGVHESPEPGLGLGLVLGNAGLNIPRSRMSIYRRFVNIGTIWIYVVNSFICLVTHYSGVIWGYEYWKRSQK